MKNNYTVTVKLSEDMLRKLLYISEAEGRTPQSHLTFMLRNNVAYFERTKGRLTDKELRGVDISDFEPDEKES